MTQKFDIPINIKVYAKNEKEAEQIALNFLWQADQMLNLADIDEYEIFEFISPELKNSCCC